MNNNLNQDLKLITIFVSRTPLLCSTPHGSCSSTCSPCHPSKYEWQLLIRVPAWNHPGKILQSILAPLRPGAPHKLPWFASPGQPIYQSRSRPRSLLHRMRNKQTAPTNKINHYESSLICNMSVLTCSPTSLLQTTPWLRLSHRWIILSCPAVRNCD